MDLHKHFLNMSDLNKQVHRAFYDGYLTYKNCEITPSACTRAALIRAREVLGNGYTKHASGCSHHGFNYYAATTISAAKEDNNSKNNIYQLLVWNLYQLAMPTLQVQSSGDEYDEDEDDSIVLEGGMMHMYCHDFGQCY